MWSRCVSDVIVALCVTVTRVYTVGLTHALRSASHQRRGRAYIRTHPLAHTGLGAAGVGKSAWEGWGPALRMRRKCPDTWTGWGGEEGRTGNRGEGGGEIFFDGHGEKKKRRRGKDPVLKLRYSRGRGCTYVPFTRGKAVARAPQGVFTKFSYIEKKYIALR